MRVSRTVSRTVFRTGALLAVLALTACTGGGDGDPRTAGPRKASVSPTVVDPAPVPSGSPAPLPTGSLGPATQTLRYAPAAARAAGTVRFEFEQVFDTPNGRGVLRGSGVADLARDRSTYVTDYRRASKKPLRNPELTFVTSETDWWVKVPSGDRAAVGKAWAHAPIEYAGYGVGPLWPVRTFVDYLTMAEDAEEVRPDVYRAGVPVERAARSTRPELYDSTLLTLREATGGGPLPVEVELDGEGRPVRITVSFRHSRTNVPITTTVRLSGYGAAAAIDLPDPAEVRRYPETAEVMTALGIA